MIPVPPILIGRALTCVRCDWNTESCGAGCSCLIHCGAHGCTGAHRPAGGFPSVPLKTRKPKETEK